MRWIAALPAVLAVGVFCAQGQAPPPPAPDPHENPELNGGRPSSPEPEVNPTRPDPHAVPNPVPVRAPNLAAHPPEADAHRPATDSEMMRKIRNSLLQDKTTSSYARHVRIISHAGSVRLEGKLPSAAARHAVEEKAIGVAGTANLTNNIEIQAPPVKK
jgi:hyperosmotically inducible periplasmic protein